MQKVSKQSLAMIALSILLAISIALTFTFAGLSASNTASGTITFQGDATVVWSYTGEIVGKYEQKDGSITVKLSEADFDLLADGSASLKDTTKREFEYVSVSITNTANSNLKYKISKTSTDTGMTVTCDTFKGAIEYTTGAVGKTLSQIITDIKVTNAEAAKDLTFEITAAVGANVNID